MEQREALRCRGRAVIAKYQIFAEDGYEGSAGSIDNALKRAQAMANRSRKEMRVYETIPGSSRGILRAEVFPKPRRKS